MPNIQEAKQCCVSSHVEKSGKKQNKAVHIALLMTKCSSVASVVQIEAVKRMFCPTSATDRQRRGSTTVQFPEARTSQQQASHFAGEDSSEFQAPPTFRWLTAYSMYCSKLKVWGPLRVSATGQTCKKKKQEPHPKPACQDILCPRCSPAKKEGLSICGDGLPGRKSDLTLPWRGGGDYVSKYVSKVGRNQGQVLPCQLNSGGLWTTQQTQHSLSFKRSLGFVVVFLG